MELRDAIIREPAEWSNIWWDHPEDLSQPRVLLIGDSISMGYTQTVIERLRGIAHADRLANSRGTNDPALYKELGYVLGECRYELIHFNNGLHAWHIPDDVYSQSLRHMVQTLIQYGQGARLVWASSTPLTLPDNPTVLEAGRNDQLCRRNTLAEGIMQEYDIPINDLYSLVLGRPELGAGDGCHYNEAGQTVQGNMVADVILAGLRGQS